MTALRGGRESRGDGGVTFTTRRSAFEACDRLQQEFDDDCEPRRVYVVDSDGIPINAGGAGT